MFRKYEIEREVQRRTEELCQSMHIYLDVFENECPFNSQQLRLHVQTICLRRELGDVSTALRNDDYLKSLWKTLDAWGLNARRATLLPLEEFKQVFFDHEEEISRWNNITIDDTSRPLREDAQYLWQLINKTRVSEADNPIVSGSKAFHHILPELIPPIDREYTRPFFKYWGQYFQYGPDRVFPYIWEKFAMMAHKVNLRQYVWGEQDGVQV